VSAQKPPAPAAGPRLPEPAGNRSPSTPERGQGTAPAVAEIGGPKGPEPTRYGDWERNGRCSDF
jgi:hypothetical protein